MDRAAFRNDLVELLQGGNAHVTPKEVLEGIDLAIIGVRPGRLPHSMWELLEHIRITQQDILRYTLDPKWKSPKWPEGYWPAGNEKPNQKQWAASQQGFFSDLAELTKFVTTTELDLTSKIPHGEGRTYLRQILLVGDHNSYHFGQLVLVRKALGNWD
jgi:hypothetical protein